VQFVAKNPNLPIFFNPSNPLNPWQKNLSTNQFVLICAICGKKIQKSNHPTIQKSKKKRPSKKRDVSKTTQPA
jgi:hypothetical protein